MLFSVAMRVKLEAATTLRAVCASLSAKGNSYDCMPAPRSLLTRFVLNHCRRSGGRPARPVRGRVGPSRPSSPSSPSSPGWGREGQAAPGPRGLESTESIVSSAGLERAGRSRWTGGKAGGLAPPGTARLRPTPPGPARPDRAGEWSAGAGRGLGQGGLRDCAPRAPRLCLPSHSLNFTIHPLHQPEHRQHRPTRPANPCCASPCLWSTPCCPAPPPRCIPSACLGHGCAVLARRCRRASVPSERDAWPAA